MNDTRIEQWVVMACWWLALFFSMLPLPLHAGEGESAFRLSTKMNGVSVVPYLLVLEDPGRSLTLDDVTQPVHAERFHPVGRISSRGLSNSAWWVRLEVINFSDQRLRWFLQSTSATLDFLDLYAITPGQPVQEWHLGDHRPFSARPIPHETQVIAVEALPWTVSQIHVRLAFAEVGFIDAELIAWTPREFTEYRDKNTILTGLYVGGLVFMAIFNLFIFLSTRQLEYFWYVAYVATYVMAFTSVLGFGHRYFFTNSVVLTEMVPNVSMYLSMLLAMQFNRVFLDMPRLLPRLDRFLFWLMVVLAGSIFLVSFGYKRIGMQLAMLDIVVLAPAFPLLGIGLWWRGYRKARFLTIAWIFLAVGLVIGWGRYEGYVATSFLVNWMGRFGIWIEAALLSFALADNINILRQEKELAIQREKEAILQAKTELENKVLERTEDLQVARRRADAANRAKSDFLANMSHEIRTPMNAIIGTALLVLKTGLTERQEKYIKTIRNASHALLEIINDILDFSKIEAGELKIEQTPFNLYQLIDDVVQLMVGRAEEKNLEFLILCHIQRDVVVIGDPLRVRQILINLVGNALKFTERGEVCIGVEPVHETSFSVTMRFWVTDSGIGMSQKQMEGLFQPFSQADVSHSRKYGGTGLGLVISRHLVTAMQGELSVESALGEGSTFSCLLTFRRGTAASHDEVVVLEPRLRGLRVLVVDDHEHARNILVEALESFSFQVSAVSSGFAALELLQKVDRTPGEQPFGLVLMDWNMPRMDGLETTRRIRHDTSLSRLPTIIMVSAYNREEVIQEAERVGLAGYLSKPVTPSELFDAIMRAIGGVRLSMRRAEDGTAWQPTPLEMERMCGIRVLLVDDIAINREIAQEFLVGFGCSVTMAESGQAAIEALQIGLFDAVLMDIQMPDMNGFQATEAIRRRWPERCLPIIAMTAHALADDKQRCLEAGMDDYVTKPIDPEKLVRILLHWVHAGDAASMPQRRAADTAQVVDVTQESSVLPTDLPGIDLGRALRLVHGNQRLLRHSLMAFARDYHQAAAEIDAACQTGELERASRLVHTIKGVAGNLAMTRLYDLAQGLDAGLKRGEIDREKLSAWSMELSRVMQGVTSLAPLPGRGGVIVPREALNLALFDEQCDALANLLRQGEFTAPERLPEIAAALQGHESVLFARLEAQTLAFASEEALATLVQLRQTVRQA
ncbi:MAG: response regulator [Magnetococcales bacterium]|nr:response regulator [Magnetococcales bacterium]